MDDLINILVAPSTQAIIAGAATVLITNIAKRYKLAPDIVAFILAAVLGTAGYAIFDLVPREILEQVAIYIMGVYGLATAIHRFIKYARK